MIRARGLVAGVDEAGRGPLAGPVVAAAVILDPGRRIHGIRDSKLLSSAERGRVARRLRAHALAWSVAWADPREIDVLNIFGATMLAMRRAILGLCLRPQRLLIDGDHCPQLEDLGMACRVEAVVDGDRRIKSIGAASILAKVTRDGMMMAFDGLYPGYGFSGHKGYCTEVHGERLARLGPCRIHRRSFAPVGLALRGGEPDPPEEQ